MAIAINPKSRMRSSDTVIIPPKKGTYSSKQDDDNMYLLANGQRKLTHDWNAGAHKIIAAALEVKSTTQAKSFKLVYNDTEDCLDFLYIEYES